MMIGVVSVSVLLSYQTYIAWIEDPILTTGKRAFIEMWLGRKITVVFGRINKVVQTDDNLCWTNFSCFPSFPYLFLRLTFDIIILIMEQSKELSFATNVNFLILISFQPDGLNF